MSETHVMPLTPEQLADTRAQLYAALDKALKPLYQELGTTRHGQDILTAHLVDRLIAEIHMWFVLTSPKAAPDVPTTGQTDLSVVVPKEMLRSQLWLHHKS